jgi:ribonuclease P protein component
VNWVDDPRATPPRVAFAFARTVGNAVARNRLRRRCRVVLAEQAAVGLPAGYFLVGAGPGVGDASFDEIVTSLAQVCNRIRQATS